MDDIMFTEEWAGDPSTFLIGEDSLPDPDAVEAVPATVQVSGLAPKSFLVESARIANLSSWVNALPRETPASDGCEGSKVLVQEAASRYFHTQLNKMCIQFYAFLLGLPDSHSRSKKDIVTEFVSLSIRPIRAESLKNWLVRFNSIKAGLGDPGPLTDFEAPDGAAVELLGAAPDGGGAIAGAGTGLPPPSTSLVSSGGMASAHSLSRQASIRARAALAKAQEALREAEESELKVCGAVAGPHLTSAPLVPGGAAAAATAGKASTGAGGMGPPSSKGAGTAAAAAAAPAAGAAAHAAAATGGITGAGGPPLSSSTLLGTSTFPLAAGGIMGAGGPPLSSSTLLGTSNSPLVSMSTTQWQEMLAMFAGGANRQADAPTTPKLTLPPEMRVLADARLKVDQRMPFNVAILSKVHLRKLETFAMRDDATRTALGDGSFITRGMDLQPALSLMTNPDAVQEGLSAWIELHGSSSILAIRERVIDLQRWSNLVWTFQSNKVRACLFINAFMQKHAKADNWSDLFSTDQMLMLKYFFAPGDSVLPHGGAGSPVVASTRSEKRKAQALKAASLKAGGSAKRSQGSGGDGGGRHRWSGQGKPPKFCFSRIDQTKHCQHMPKCRFDHNCPCCPSEVHAAAVCPHWDQAKADRAHAGR
jgi:hypothetical protein